MGNKFLSHFLNTCTMFSLDVLILKYKKGRAHSNYRKYQERLTFLLLNIYDYLVLISCTNCYSS